MNLEEETIKAEYYPYPPNSTWEEIEEINKKHIEEWKDYLETIEKEIEEDIKEEDIQIVIHISKNPSEEEVRRVEFYKNFIIRQGLKNVIVEEVEE